MNSLYEIKGIAQKKFKKKRDIPFIQQLEAADCGASCLAMALNFFGFQVPAIKVREVVGPATFGVSLSTLIESGLVFGLRGRAIRIHWSSVEKLSKGTILHWEFNHFVIIESCDSKTVKIIDPGLGRRVIPLHEFSVKFTGLALEFDPVSTVNKNIYKKEKIGLEKLKELLRYPEVLKRVILASLVIQLIGVIFPLATGLIIDTVLPTENKSWLIIIALGAAVLIACGAASDYARARSLIYLKAKYDYNNTTAFLKHMLDLPYSFFQRRALGDLTLRVHSNAHIREAVSAITFSVIIDGSMVVTYTVILMIIMPPVAIVCLAIGFIQAILLWTSRSKLAEYMAEEQFSKYECHSKLVQVLAGIHTLKSSGAEPEGLQMWSGKFVSELNGANQRQLYRSFLDALIYFVQSTSPVIILCVGAWLVIDEKSSLGMMLTCSTLALGMLRPLFEIAKNIISIFEVKIHFERIQDVISHQPERTNNQIEANQKLTGKISVEKIFYTYEGSKNPILKNISFSIEAGQKIAIVGATGCGKSTLAHVLLGLYEPQSGNILFDDIRLTDKSIRELRRKIGFVPQDPFLFEGSVRQNISLVMQDAPLSEVVRAAKISCIHDDIMEMIGGYDSRVISGGRSISGGQRQRIAIARAILGRPKILILDEASSALDAETELRVCKNLQSLNCTVIVISHRLSTVKDSNLIVVMRTGEVVEMGKHDDLMQLDGEYKRLQSAQT